jgi:hypothetical protein
LSASITAASSARSTSNSTTTNGVPAGAQTYDFSPASRSSESVADMSAKTPSSSWIRVRGLFSIAPRACRMKHASTASSASRGVSSSAISSSVR